MSDKANSVVVVGGGIAGSQAALDLANSGIKTIIVEKSPSIGGRMAQLDKTFPTNDCSMCILSPKLVEVGRHSNIELLTLSEVEEVKGEEGAFDVKVIKHARYVNEDSCTGCGACAATCPVSYEHKIPERMSYRNLVSDEDGQRIESVLKKYEDEEGALVQILQDINEEFNYLPENVLKYVSELLDVPLSQIYNVATFYNAFSLTPRGDHIIKVCSGTACHVRGSSKVLGEIERALKIKSGETTSDLKFTLETVNCLGACALGPVVVVDGEYHSTTAAKVDKLLKKIGTQEGEDMHETA
jgi:NADH:ubiquinone oxidoreductase subunit E